jgi:hypothetical protein
MVTKDETQITTRHRRKLATLREERANEHEYESHTSTGTDRRYSEVAKGSIQRTYGANQGDDRDTASRTQGATDNAGINGRYDQGIRPSDNASLDPVESDDRSHASDTVRTESDLVTLTDDATEEEKRERQRELARQRKQRQRDRERAEQREQEPLSFPQKDTPPPDASPRFALKNPLSSKQEEPEKIKLFSKQEAEDEAARLAFIYFRASGLLDDVLEIIVKGHEKVAIWQLEESEADMLASLHLEQAKRDKQAAKSARLLLAMYDRFFIFSLVTPRFVATSNHIIMHKGVSFK